MNWICAFLTPLLPTTLTSYMTPFGDMFMHVKSLMIGLNLLMEQHVKWLLEGNLVKLFKAVPDRKSDAGSKFTLQDLQCLRDLILAHDTPSSPISLAVRHAIDDLQRVYVESQGKSVFSWLPVVGSDFQEEMMRGDSAALITTMCWSALLAKLDDSWWTMYGGRRIIEELSLLVKAQRNDWDDIIHWCCNQVGISEIV